METKFTKGEWSVDGHNLTSVIVSEQYNGNHNVYQHVCSCDYGYSDPLKWIELNKANAKLISAAPDLLEALQELVSANDGNGKSVYACVLKAKAAIKKATE